MTKLSEPAMETAWDQLSFSFTPTKSMYVATCSKDGTWSEGELLPFGPGADRRKAGDAEAWMSRIRASEISHVMSFVPSSVEISWMNTNPQRFTRLTGHENRWGLYRVLPGP